jgi:hypothetical protein
LFSILILIKWLFRNFGSKYQNSHTSHIGAWETTNNNKLILLYFT